MTYSKHGMKKGRAFIENLSGVHIFYITTTSLHFTRLMNQQIHIQNILAVGYNQPQSPLL